MWVYVILQTVSEQKHLLSARVEDRKRTHESGLHSIPHDSLPSVVAGTSTETHVDQKTVAMPKDVKVNTYTLPSGMNLHVGNVAIFTLKFLQNHFLLCMVK
jgi:hypothetical protein